MVTSKKQALGAVFVAPVLGLVMIGSASAAPEVCTGKTARSLANAGDYAGLCDCVQVTPSFLERLQRRSDIETTLQVVGAQCPGLASLLTDLPTASLSGLSNNRGESRGSEPLGEAFADAANPGSPGGGNGGNGGGGDGGNGGGGDGGNGGGGDGGNGGGGNGGNGGGGNGGNGGGGDGGNGGGGNGGNGGGGNGGNGGGGNGGPGNGNGNNGNPGNGGGNTGGSGPGTGNGGGNNGQGNGAQNGGGGNGNGGRGLR
ncbi:hypothetical protein [Ruegeria sp. HKCCA6837]|uniref:hypothetical protein n=1 Tax=Ruegeria sp. HKCCA6837 TaxID=2682989 RepID=UPI001489960B|nr:hypothetical protein [Ruegeria sp. HKCCA6837]